MVPSSEAPGDGQLVVSVEVTPLATPEFRPGKQPGTTHVIQQRLTDILLGCQTLKLSDLCIAQGQAVWVLYLDLYVLNAAGSLLDTSLLAAVAALQDTRLPAVHMTEEGNVERDGLEDVDADDIDAAAAAADKLKTVPLPLHGTPLSTTCGIYKQQQLLADPDHEEEGLMAAKVTVVLDEKHDLLGELV